MRLLLDEAVSPRLAKELKAFGHDVVTVRQLGLRGKTDLEVWSLARRQGRAVITADYRDYRALAQSAGSKHHGVLILRLEETSPEAIGGRLQTVLEGLNQRDFRGRVLEIFDEGETVFPPLSGP
ncbi:MAG: DUF5615 family PIN-like protein [Deltaproteobacteria bacterium]|nr:DUF5615 family PIN-like protein [Deltaproteobacteria bacterium]